MNKLFTFLLRKRKFVQKLYVARQFIGENSSYPMSRSVSQLCSDEDHNDNHHAEDDEDVDDENIHDASLDRRTGFDDFLRGWRVTKVLFSHILQVVLFSFGHLEDAGHDANNTC